jgi:hypothetical protein
MTSTIPKHLVDILRDLAAAHHPELLSALTNPESTEHPPLAREQRLSLREAAADELCRTGFRPDYEPNQRGLLLEELIDWLGRDSLPP